MIEAYAHIHFMDEPEGDGCSCCNIEHIDEGVLIARVVTLERTVIEYRAEMVAREVTRKIRYARDYD